MSYFVVLYSEATSYVLPEEFSSRLEADNAAAKALKTGQQCWDPTTALTKTAIKAFICEVVAHAEAEVKLTERK